VCGTRRGRPPCVPLEGGLHGHLAPFQHEDEAPLRRTSRIGRGVDDGRRRGAKEVATAAVERGRPRRLMLGLGDMRGKDGLDRRRGRRPEEEAMAAWIGGVAAWISGADDGRRRRRGRPGSAAARRGSAAAQPGSAALTTAGGGGEGGRRCEAARLGSRRLAGGCEWWGRG
jgi:hypothetical protein